MSVVYVKEQGANIKKSSKCIQVDKNGNRLLEIPVANIDNLSVIGNIQISTQAMQLMMENGIDISYFTRYGKYIGHAQAEHSKNIFLRFAQYELYNDMPRRLNMARDIVENKTSNQIKMIRSFRWKKESYRWDKEVKQMENNLLELKNKDTINEIMGIEGICSSLYFKAYGKMFDCRFEFNGRNRRPPRDPINALISLGYTFLTKEICSVLDAESFEMYLGFLHGIRYGRKSLALDIVEEFRQPVVDRLILRLLNKRMITEFDFEEDSGKVLLNEEGFQKFCLEFERFVGGRLAEEGAPGFRVIMKQQAAHLKNAIRQKEKYVPYRWEAGKDVSDML